MEDDKKLDRIYMWCEMYSDITRDKEYKLNKINLKSLLTLNRRCVINRAKFISSTKENIHSIFYSKTVPTTLT
jgi:hypothetical protein